jgi:tetratricopeptide (TPR) repeat protein
MSMSQSYLEARELLRENKIDEAIELLLSLEKSSESNYLNLYALGYAYQLKNKLASALAYYEKSILANENFAPPFSGIANIHTKFEKYEIALNNYKNAHEREPLSEEHILNIMSTLLRLNRVHECRKYAKFFTDKKPTTLEHEKILSDMLRHIGTVAS